MTTPSTRRRPGASLLARHRRFVPTIVGALALILGFVALEVGTVSKGDAEDATLAADRSADAAASRGGPRTPDVAADAIASSAAAGTLRASADELDPTTTTTAAPPTTLTRPAASPPAKGVPAHSEAGKASYYAQPWSSKGCAHKSIAKGTVLTVTNVATGASATCVVNDRGPFIAGRIIDLDTTIFRRLATTSQGVFSARITW